ncbi:hypothetical protein N7532_007770 [Penicillium argentinense]|uniref:Uncharacterized protein n=1 Tax=Penicillium argentinense TaxID=1131581 RepID=A0A9W9K1D5_9EURO|nr:uncharacterized protein N7532_007770 [Penicillium argentinense]KAJ5089086.1 hypothetical protein N7532_007770 [Penicillium argentinense]
MYDSTPSLDLHRLSRQSLHDRYESDEEAVSESDAGGHDFFPSLVGSQRAGTFDSDLSADEASSQIDPDSDREEHHDLLAPEPLSTTNKRSQPQPRPVSMDTLKRNSNATFGDDAYVFDPEEDMVLELPSPESTPALASSMFLKPSIYVAPNSIPTNKSRSRSPSPSSIFSVEHAEIQTAKTVTMMEPPTRPTLVFINSLGTRSKGSRSRSNNSRTRANRESRIYLPKTESTLEVPRLMDSKPSPRGLDSMASSERGGSSACSTPSMTPLLEDTQLPPGATIANVSEIPVVPYIPPSPRLRPQSMYRPRPRTAGSEKPFPPASTRPRRPTDTPPRPASIRSDSNSSVPCYRDISRPVSPFRDDIRPGYIADHNSDAGSLTRTCSPASTASSPPFSKCGPTHSSKGSVSNILAHRSPMMRRVTRKHSASSSIHSMSSLRSEMDTAPTASASSSQPVVSTMNYDAHVVRKPSQRRHARHNSSAHAGKGFMGIKFGKRAFTRT